MAVEFRPVTCAACRKHWKLTDIPPPLSWLEEIQRYGEGVEKGVLCSQCDVFLCDWCFSYHGHKCFFCGNRDCSPIWVEDLEQIELDLLRHFRRDVLFYVVAGVCQLLVYAVFLPFVNPSIPHWLSIIIAIFVAPLLAKIGLSHMMSLSPFDEHGQVGLGRLFGAILGVTGGIIAGWDRIFFGGTLGLGIVPWSLALGGLNALVIGRSLSTAGRCLKK